VAPEPEDLELTLEAYERAGDAAGAVAHWEANRRALARAAGLGVGAGSEGRGRGGGQSVGVANMTYDEEITAVAAEDAEDGGDGEGMVLGCEPTRRAWTALIKAHCDAGEVVVAAALLEEAVEAEAAKGNRGHSRNDSGGGGGGKCSFGLLTTPSRLYTT